LNFLDDGAQIEIFFIGKLHTHPVDLEPTISPSRPPIIEVQITNQAKTQLKPKSSNACT